MTALAATARRCASCACYLSRYNEGEVCWSCWDRAIRETLAPPPRVEAPMCEWPAPLTTRVVGLLPGTLDDLCARLPDARRRAVKAAIGQLVAHGRAHATGAHGGRHGARRVYLPGPRPLSEDRAA